MNFLDEVFGEDTTEHGPHTRTGDQPPVRGTSTGSGATVFADESGTRTRRVRLLVHVGAWGVALCAAAVVLSVTGTVTLPGLGSPLRQPTAAQDQAAGARAPVAAGPGATVDAPTPGAPAPTSAVIAVPAPAGTDSPAPTSTAPASDTPTGIAPGGAAPSGSAPSVTTPVTGAPVAGPTVAPAPTGAPPIVPAPVAPAPPTNGNGNAPVTPPGQVKHHGR